MKRNQRYTIWAVFVGIIGVAALAFFLQDQSKKPLVNVAHSLARPLALGFSATGFWLRDKVEFFSSISQLKQENERLQRENLDYQSQLAQLKDVKSENEIFRQELSLAPRDSLTLEAALVIGRDMSGRHDLMILSKGEAEGIHPGMAVIVNKGILVGKVLQTTTHTATVELLLSQEIRIMAELADSHEKGIVQGAYGTAVTMEDIPQTVEVKPGDTVITAYGGTLPGGLLIGYIKDISATPDQLFQRATLIIPVRLHQIRMVWVVVQ